jgi:hypothetical protein
MIPPATWPALDACEAFTWGTANDLLSRLDLFLLPDQRGTGKKFRSAEFRLSFGASGRKDSHSGETARPRAA